VEAARGLGASNMRLMFRHILPQCVAPFLILATTHLGVAIIIEASLGFLGVGIPPPTPTWGNMLSDALNSGAYYLASAVIGVLLAAVSVAHIRTQSAGIATQ